jgi:hypothetical protein
MRNEQGKRPRILKTDKGKVIIDSEAYIDNLCSLNAKNIGEFNNIFVSKIWKDKHYTKRMHHGEDDGTPREGIDEHLVFQLIEDTFVHVLHYGLKYGSIVNYPPFNPKTSIRIVLQDRSTDEDDFLNVAVEYHFKDTKTFEVTIWTAMKISNFYIRDSQYVIELFPDKTILRRNERRVLIYKSELNR